MDNDTINRMRERLTLHRSRLHELQLQKAHRGISSPPEINLEIQSLEKEISLLKKNIQEQIHAGRNLICPVCGIGALTKSNSYRSTEKVGVFFTRTQTSTEFVCEYCQNAATIEVPIGSEERKKKHAKIMIVGLGTFVGTSAIASIVFVTPDELMETMKSILDVEFPTGIGPEGEGGFDFFD